MPRVKLRDQDAYPFTTEVELSGADMNHADHMGFDRILSVAQRAWSVMFAELGVTDTNLGDGITGIIISDAVINYRAEAFAGERLKVELCPYEIDVSSFRLAMRVEATDRSRLVALLETGIVAFNYRDREKGRFPPALIAGLRNLTGP